MTATEFAARARAVATDVKTVYMKGAFGAPVSEAILDRLSRLYPSWYTESRQKQLRALIGSGTFGFDCVCFLKGLLWGWRGETDSLYGGAVYASAGMPDLSVPALIKTLEQVSSDPDTVQVGEVVYLPGHVGVYVGDGLVAECTTSFTSGVLLSAYHKRIAGYPTRVWQGHGRLPQLSYSRPEVALSLPHLDEGDQGEAVRALQALMNLRMGSALATDGVLGPVSTSVLLSLRGRLSLPKEGGADERVWQQLLKGE